MFLPTTRDEMVRFGWKKLDVILVCGDAYIDSPFIGVAIIGMTLLNAGYRVGIIAQPNVHSDQDICRLGEPELFWGVTGGCMDSMVANYTATLKKRQRDDLTPGGINNARPDRAVIVYTNLIRRYFKQTKPIVLGGVEASLRRIAHYDYWQNQIRKSVIFDAKADYLVYGMGEKTILELAECLSTGKNFRTLRGICYISNDKPTDSIELPAYNSVCSDHDAFIDMFHLFYQNNDPLTAQALAQKHDSRYLIHNPPQYYLNQNELDSVYDMDFERDLHPYYKVLGDVKALETLKFSITSHVGCYGECNFCSIAVHQGRTVRWRSIESIVKEAEKLSHLKDFKGYIQDVGGPSLNMYGFECIQKLKYGACKDKRCLYPDICRHLPVNHGKQMELFARLRELKGIKKIRIGSGIRHDLILHDKKHGHAFIKALIDYHESGQIKIAPEHVQNHVLKLMGKPDKESLIKFKALIDQLNKASKKPTYLTYYFIVAHPGCTKQDMFGLRKFAEQRLHFIPEQVQIFTPTPSTFSSLMYWTGKNPFTRESIDIERHINGKEQQKQILQKSF